MSYNLISIHQPHRSRRTSHDLVLILPIYFNKLLQSHLFRHFHYLNGISKCTYLGCCMSSVLMYIQCMSWLLYVLVSCWPKFQSIFNGLQSFATDDEKHYQCHNIVLNKKTWPLFLEFNRWIQSLFAPMGDRDIVESADKGMKVFDMGQFDFSWV